MGGLHDERSALCRGNQRAHILNCRRLMSKAPTEVTISAGGLVVPNAADGAR
jgi:hypothetical protein